MECPKCRHANREGARFCDGCGAPLSAHCPSCKAENRPGARFCDGCGTPLSGQSPGSQAQTPLSYTPRHLAERILSEQAGLEARATPDGERKTITALFADIKGSMELIEGLDPEEARRIVDPALRLMMDAVHRYEGYVAQSTGDGIFALFGAPIAHEDHPQRALYAALRMQEESERYAERVRLEKGINVQVRVGVNTGEVVVRSIRKDDLHTDYVPVGHATGLAARMEGLATPGSILVSEHTYNLTEGYFEFKPRGAAQVKGVSEPVRIYEVLGVGPLRTRLQRSVRRGLVQFVGRQGEMAQMRRALDLAREGHGQIVAVVGDPGVGKSRLCYEFKLLSQRGCLVLETFSVSHGKAYPYLPLIELLKNYFQISLQDNERRRREKVTGRVLTLDRSLEDTLPYLFALLTVSDPASSLDQMDPQIRRRRTFEALKRLLVRESLNQPLILIVEDLQWLDSETEAFLLALSEGLATAPVLLLVNYRPEYRHSWGSKTFYTQLRLDPLGEREAGELLTALVGDDADLHPLKHLILSKTEGTPFFMEEIVQALFDQGVLVRSDVGATGRSSLQTRPLTEIQIPPTVQGVLAGRIDRLPAEEKALLQTLSVIGREFSLSLLKQVVEQPEEGLYGPLSHLQEAEFIYEQPAFPEVEYTFKHALTQEVAYTSLLMERRRGLHERTAQAMESLFKDRMEDAYSELAHHYSRGGNTGKAVEYLRLAGQQAVQQSAFADAVNHLTTALDLLQALPDTVERTNQELLLQRALGMAWMVTRGYASPEVGRAYTRARDLCEKVGETPQLFGVLRGLSIFYQQQGKSQTARELREELLSLAQRAQDSSFLPLAHMMLGGTLHFLGELASARSHLEQGFALYDPRQQGSPLIGTELDPRMTFRSLLAPVLWFLGYPDQAAERSREALALALGPYRLAAALCLVARLHLLRREGRAAQERAEAATAISTEQGFPQLLTSGTVLRGWALAEQGQMEEGIAQMRQGLTDYRATGAEVLRPSYLALLGEAYGKAGQAGEGLAAIEEALALTQESGGRLYEAEIYRVKGELLLKTDLTPGPSPAGRGEVPGAGLLPARQRTEVESEAEVCFHKAISVARAQQAKSWELRATVSLCRLWQVQGKGEEARQMLAEIYGWFTEGFDTADLKDAKALMEALK